MPALSQYSRRFLAAVRAAATAVWNPFRSIFAKEENNNSALTVTNETESKKKKKEADNDETTEDTDYSTWQKEEDAIQPLEVSSERIAEKHRNKVIAIFEKYRDVLATKLQNDSSVIDINDLTMYLIHLHILLDVVEKEIRYVTRTKHKMVE